MRHSGNARRRSERKKVSDDPSWVSSYVFGIASETGWTERFVFEELSLTRGWQYRHCLLRKNGAQTFFLANADDLEENRKSFEELLNVNDDPPLL